MGRVAVLGFILAAVVTAVPCPPAARAEDWPQWLGPRRDGVWREAGIAERFPEQGPAVRWRVPVAGGYAGPAVAGGRVFVTDWVAKPAPKGKPDPNQPRALPGTERVWCFNEADGSVLWKHEYDCPYTISYPAGPRATPTVDGDRVYSLGSEGHLFCFDTKTGKVRWSKRFSGERSPTPIWGFAAHPLVDGKKLICLTGGTTPQGKPAVVTAFDKLTGNVLWTSLSAREPGYCPPVVYEGDGSGKSRQLIVWHPESLNSLDPETGKPHWSHPFGPVENGVSISTPVLHRDPTLGDLVMVSSPWDGSLVVKLDPKDPRKSSVLWKRGGNAKRRQTDALHTLMGTNVIRDGHVYGVCAGGELRCLDLATGDRLWETFAATNPEGEQVLWSTAFLTPIGDTGSRFVLANEHGDLMLADLTPQGYTEVSRAHLLDPTNADAGRPVLWSHPAYANGSVYWRNDKELVCASLRGPEQKAKP